MGMKELKYFRLIIPGILIILLILLVTQGNIFDIKIALSSIQAKNTWYTIAIVCIGILYYVLNIRYILWKPFNERVRNNIKNKLLAPCAGNLNKQQLSEIKQGNKIINIFYKIIDSDDSLIEKAKRVRFNGLIWTSMMDVVIISFFGSLIFWFKYFIEGVENSFTWAWLLLAISFIFVIFTEICTRKHISLSDEQLDMICQFHKQDLCRMIDESLQS